MSTSMKCKDHLGNEFDSIKDMCKYWNISNNIYNSRKRYGWDLEKILTTPVKDKCNTCIDHLGNEFKTEKDMCKCYGLHYSTYRFRKESNWDLEKILTTPANLTVQDHLGNEFKTEKEMYEYWNITGNSYTSRKAKGWDLEKILTTPVKSKSNTCTDHLGNEFKTEKEMYKYWNISVGVYSHRKKSGWDLDRILTTPEKESVYDHLGNEFKTEKEMYEYYGLHSSTYTNRKNKGWSLEDILTKDLICSNIYYDEIRQIESTSTEISTYYNISIPIFTDRLRSYKSFVRAVGVSFMINPNHIKVNQTKYDITIVRRIKKGKDVFECYINNDDGTQTFKIMSYDMIDKHCLEQYRKLNNLEMEN